ncbi:MAG: GGDEF domain-containing protein [Bacilli bacterium]
MFKKIYQYFYSLFKSLLNQWGLKLPESKETNAPYQIALLNISRLQAISLFLIVGVLFVWLSDVFNQNRLISMDYFYILYALVVVVSLTTIILIRVVIPKKTFSMAFLKAFYRSFWAINTSLVILVYLLDAYSSSKVASLFAFYLILAAIPIFSFGEILAFLMLPNLLMVGVWLFDILTLKETIYTVFLYEGFAVTISQMMYHTLLRIVNYEIKLRESSKKLELMSLLDPLTELNNRFGLNKAFDNLKSKTNNNDLFFVIALDIDNFKIFNDQYGHLLGDEYLVFLGKTIKMVFCNDHSATGRIGGDEFIAFCRTKSEQEVDLKMRLFYEALNEMSLSDQFPKTSITLSCGIAFEEIQRLSTWTDLYEEADRLLFDAKNRGRNQFIFASKKPSE